MKTVKRETPASLSAVRRASTRPECTNPNWAIVLGGADNVFVDVADFEFGIYGMPWPGLIIAANDVGVHYPDLDHWASFHVDKLAKWMQEREAAGYARPQTWGWRPGQTTDHVLYPWSGGSSGMLAAQVALVLGATKVVLCGMPMTPTPHFHESREFDADHTTWSEADGHWRSWVRVHAQGWFDGRIRSMSGRTRDLFGEPTREWLLA